MRVYCRTLPNEIHLRRFDKFAALDNLPEAKGDRRQQQKGIVAEEGGIVPREDEAGISKREKDNREPCKVDVREVGLTPALERERISIDSLRPEAPVKEDVSDDHSQIIDQATGGSERNEPGEFASGISMLPLLGGKTATYQ